MAFESHELRQVQGLFVQVHPGIGELRGDRAYRAVVGGEDLVRLGQAAADSGVPVRQVDAETGLGEVKGCLGPGDASAQDQDGSGFTGYIVHK
jgi:hypothetical protein